MKARVTLHGGWQMNINATPEEIQRLAMLEGYTVEILPDRKVFLPAGYWSEGDVHQPLGLA